MKNKKGRNRKFIKIYRRVILCFIIIFNFLMEKIIYGLLEMFVDVFIHAEWFLRP